MVIAYLLSAAALQAAPADSVAFDMRCMLVTERLRERGEESVRNMAAAAMSFYFGRLDARLGADEFEAGLRGEEQAMRTMTEADFAAALRACGNFMTARGDAMQAIAARVEGPPPARPHP